ncbi:hypothetical protein ALC60_06552 [Trachymyrmex zeteki]|uniref:Uncharacterized protein n=1 Tax=Mycetomoellerius zeteki TaxID=64791 RepID=A0A151X2P8_9HYME|nr:hypothetical protein ALC60_06552 [Trachymyrmex zeteki]
MKRRAEYVRVERGEARSEAERVRQRHNICALGETSGARVLHATASCSEEETWARNKWLMPLVWGTAMFQPWVKTFSRGVAVTPSLRPFDRVKPPGSTTQIELCQGDEKSFAN